jgi:Bacterial Ig-like domain (group 3)/Concanavalin A-like lectin/glucanases superfamily/FlgD Ig-like domain
MDDGTGSSAANTVGGGPALALSHTTWAPSGQSGSALSFNGTNATAVAPASLLHPADLTVTGWVRGDPADRPADGAVIVESGGRAACAHPSWGIYAAAASFKFGWLDSVTGQWTNLSGFTVPGHDIWDGSWHLISVYTSATSGAPITLFIDGYTSTVSMSPSYDGSGLTNDVISVGGPAGSCASAPYLRGDVDDLRIYDAQLLTDDVGSLMAPIATTTSISGPTTAVADSPACFDATVAPTPATLGSVVFTVTSTTGWTVDHDFGWLVPGVAHICLTLDAGTYSVHARYTGSHPWLTSTSSDAALTVTKITPTARVSGFLGQLSTTPFKVQGIVDGRGVIPTGTVHFWEIVGGSRTDRGSQPLSYAGTNEVSQATLTLPARANGSYAFEIDYSGDTNHGPVTGSGTLSVGHSGPIAPDSVAITSSANPVSRSSNVTFTATVSPNPGSGGIVWRIGGVNVGTTDLNASGAAQLTTSFATTPTRTVTAQFGGNDEWLTKMSDPYYEDVTGDPVTVALTVPQNPTPVGHVVATATVKPNPGGGSVAIRKTTLGDWQTVALDGTGKAVLDLGSLGAQTQTLRAQFLGNDIYGAGVSPDLELHVANPSTVTLTSNRTTAIVGEAPVVLTATVGPSDATGSVTFADDVGGTVLALGPVPVTNGIAALSTSTLRVGTHHITAHLLPPLDFLESDSAPVTLTVTGDTGVDATFRASLATFYPAKDSYVDTVSLGGVLGEQATVTIKAYTTSGALKRSWSLGNRNPGAYSVTWNGQTAAGANVPAGTYKVIAVIADTHGHARTLTSATTVSWRKVTWKSASVVRYASAGTYYGRGNVALYTSPDYAGGRILDAGNANPQCTSCGWIGGRFTFGLASSALKYRSIDIRVIGHGFTDRDHPGSISIADPNPHRGPNRVLVRPDGVPTFATTDALCPTSGGSQTCGTIVSPALVGSAKTVESWVWMTEMWGDAFDLNYLKFSYQYAVWA